MNITDLISGGVGSQAINSISEKLGVDKDKAQYVVAAAVPLMMSALNYNASKSPEQASGIQNAIDSKHNGSIFDNLGALFNQGPTEDEDKIVNHMFGRNTDNVKETLSAKTGLDVKKIAGILALVAPLVMGYLGKKKQEGAGQSESSGGIGDLIGSVLGGAGGAASAGGLGGILGNILGGSNDNAAQPSAGGGLGDLVGDFFNQDKDKESKGGILDALTGMFGK
ncbi:DUF937 domain-containing protein [Sphingobacterium sp. DK4209]|uniref:DUF937 domain-containing protein n=1 Tax=Sphingobacterium zhuxiongii TaxID=2662364 RepID=A0A5Q0QG54_9SPHI|nr:MULTISPECIES: DUF937 domain-containing protein [unclassified Sphingobacterium]MVZ67071.1 DUF937 domain-containing protein [Sphingobacterium sp. DK4209]QGA26858.1 DUF937 domain-containing protein [Sphingobacterium sp. dk4302]